jgi:ABC-type branched-chain amino acid transport systems, periplasmic component
MKRWLAGLLTAIMVLSLTACGTSKSSGSSDPEIKIGVLQDITGTTSTLGKMIQAGAQYAADDINAKGGINGKKIKLITYDTKADVQQAITNFTRMCTTDKVSAIIGPPVANIGIAIAPISEKYNVPVLGFAIDDRATIKTDNTPYKNMFLFQPSANQQGAIMASFGAKEKGFKKFGIIYNQSNSYSLSLVDAFKKTIGSIGGASVDAEVKYQSSDKDFKTLISKLKDAGVDCIFAPNYTQELVLITQQARAIGFNGPIIAGLDAAPPFATLTGPESNKVIYINNITEADPKIQEITAAYKKASGNDATNKFFLGYDVMNIIAQTVKSAGTDPAAIQKAVEKLTNYQGLTGNITIDPKTHQTKGLEMVMFEISNQQPKEIKRYSADQK